MRAAQAEASRGEAFSREIQMRPTVAAWLRDQGMLVKTEVNLCNAYCDLVGCALVPEMVERRERRRGEWKPLHSRLVAVELKLSRVADALHQAYNNLLAVDESYVAFPRDMAQHVAARRGRWSLWDRYWVHGIGLLAVDDGACSVLIPVRPNAEADPRQLGRQVEKFWRERKALPARLRQLCEETW